MYIVNNCFKIKFPYDLLSINVQVVFLFYIPAIHCYLKFLVIKGVMGGKV